MKQTPLDFIRCGLLLALLAAGDLALLAWLAHLLRTWLGDYHVLAVLIAAPLGYGALSAVAVRLLLLVRPLRPGRYTMDSPEFAWWKLVVVTLMFGRWALRPFTISLTRPLVAWVFGARIGRNVAIDGEVDEPFLLTLADGAIIGHNAYVSASSITDGVFTLAPVVIGAGATVGVNAVVMAGTTIGERAALAGGSIAVPGTVIPPGQSWRGNPARKWVVSAAPGPEAMPAQPQPAASAARADGFLPPAAATQP